MRNPPWRDGSSGVADPATDLDAVQIEGLVGSENARAFAAAALDAWDFPLRMVAAAAPLFAAERSPEA